MKIPFFQNSITVMRTVEIMDIQLMVYNEDDPDSEIPIKVLHLRGEKVRGAHGHPPVGRQG